MQCQLPRQTRAQWGTIGYGAMALSLEDRPPRDQAIQTLIRLLEEGVILFDTADSYGLGPGDMHHNERLIAEALLRTGIQLPQLLIATKGGALQTEQGWKIEGDPEYLYRTICASFEALGGIHPIPLWQHHWPDTRYSISRMMKPVARAVEEKLIQRVGVGNYSLEQLKEARDHVQIASIQNQFNLWHREAEHNGILEFCERAGILFLPWRPMGGLGLAHRLKEVPCVAEIARVRGISEQRLIIAWLLNKSEWILPIPGSRRLENVLDCLAAKSITLTEEEMRRIDSISDLPIRVRPSAWEGSPGLAE